jgi:hypothetical protein
MKRQTKLVFTTPANNEGHQEAIKAPPTNFYDHIAGLPEWEIGALGNITEVVCCVSALSLKQHLEHATNLYLVSDGGAVDGHGYFGWVIATGTTVLWKGRGGTPGNPNLMESLRTESFGLLSLTRFVHQYCSYYNVNTNKAAVYHYCDNSTVVSRMRWYAERDIESPNISLSPDNDVQVQIEATLKEMNIQISSTWVRGHQDNTPIEELSWEAILNIEADKLATKARHETTAESTTFVQ